MDNVAKLLEDVDIPRFHRAKYAACDRRLTDIEEAVKGALKREGTLNRITAGATVAITSGSREISHIARITRTLVTLLKEKGAKPFIVPAMGSHGGATAQGQTDVLAGYGVTKETVGAPVVSSMETVQISTTPGGVAVHMDKNALGADFIIPVGRIKPHTDFRGKYESGLMKMMAIGLGKQYGAFICHKLGFADMSENVYEIGAEILKHSNIAFGLGIIENCFHGTYRIAAIPSEKIAEEEPALLDEAKSLIPVIPFDKVDIIISEEMGKDISGTGMDTNVVGRSTVLGVSKPFATRIGVFHLTEKSHGNATGMGVTDCIARGFYEAFDMEQTYPNAITSTEAGLVKMPAVMDTEKLTVQYVIKTCTGMPDGGPRIVWIKNTLSLNEFYISEELYRTSADTGKLRRFAPQYEAAFDASGTFAGMRRIPG